MRKSEKKTEGEGKKKKTGKAKGTKESEMDEGGKERESKIQMEKEKAEKKIKGLEFEEYYCMTQLCLSKQVNVGPGVYLPIPDRTPGPAL